MPVSICNSALGKIGEPYIAALTDDTTAAKVCNEQYPKVRDELLTLHPWNFATTRVALAQTTTTPAFEFDYEYAMPADFLRLLDLEDNTCKYKIEGNAEGSALVLRSDESSMKIRYVRRVTNTALMTPIFKEVLAWRLAIEIAPIILQDNSQMTVLWEAYLKTFSDATTIDSQEDYPDPMAPEDGAWLDSRWSGNAGVSSS